MMEWTQALFCLAIAAGLGTVYGAGLECYECNVHQCSRNMSGMPEKHRHETEECRQFHEMMALTNLTARSEAMDKLNQDHDECVPVLKDNCKACVKVDTTIIRQGHRGNHQTSRVISKVCGKEKLPYTEDMCEVTGPRYAKSIMCVCYADGCNSAPVTAYSILTFTSLLIVKLL